MTTIGLYFPLDQESTNALRQRLNDLAAGLGYTATRGPTAGEGNLSEMLLAIDAGEVALVLLDPLVRGYTIDHLRKLANALEEGAPSFEALAIVEGLNAIADRLDQAANRSIGLIPRR